MKRIAALLLAVMLLLTACAKTPDPTEPSTEATTAPTETTTEATTQPTETTQAPEAQYHNPLTGEPLEEPIMERPYAVVMNNIYDASGSSSAITTACDNIEAVARFLDYAYSEEGMMFDNFGVEGDTYTMIDGYPTYTDKVVPTSEDGLTSEGYTISQALSMYTRTYATGGYIQDPRYIEQYYSLPELQEAIKLWSQTDFGKYMYPPATTTTEEASELAQIMNNIETFTDEMETKFITGAEDIDASWDSYIEQLHNFGIDRAIEIKQAAYDRYMAK